MKTSVKYPGPLLAVLGCALIAFSAEAQDQNTYLYIAHAASGRVMSPTSNPAMPVDISVSGVCIAQGISYGEIRGPYSGPAGSYTVTVSTANSAAPCGGTPVFSVMAPLAAANTFIGILSLDASNQLTGSLYTVDLTSIPADQSRFEIINTTQAPLSATISSPSTGTSALIVDPGTLQEGNLASGIYTNTITDLSNNLLAGPTSAELAQRNNYLYVLAGSPDNESVQLIGPKVIAGVL
jgi:hypothetical protein